MELNFISTDQPKRVVCSCGKVARVHWSERQGQYYGPPNWVFSTGDRPGWNCGEPGHYQNNTGQDTPATQEQSRPEQPAVKPAGADVGYEPSNWGVPGFAKNRNRRPGGRAR